jgi:hypothetical protein
MTTTIEKIYDDYRRADFADRLYIYLQYPELRNDFLEIDRKEMKTAFFETVRHSHPRQSLIGRIINGIRRSQCSMRRI